MASWKGWDTCMSKTKTVTLENCFSLRARIGWQGLRSDEFIDAGPYLVTGTDFINGRVNWDTCYHVTMERYAQDKGIQLHEHDLLITKDGTIGKTAVVYDCPEKVTLNSGVFVVRAINNDVVPEYLYYVLMSHDFELYLRNIMTGSTIKHLNQEHFYKFSFTVPSDTKEQAKIAEVLSTVDEAIDRTRELIEKYKNIKTGLMQDLLTCGIDSCGRIRSRTAHTFIDSPAGVIPKEWVCKRFDKVMPLQRGHDLPSYMINEGIYPVAYSNGIAAYNDRYTKEAPCVWTGRSGTIGNVFFSDKNCWIHNTSLWVTNFCGNDAKFIYYLLSYFDTSRFAAGTGVPTLNRNDLHSQWIAIPQDISEQRQIVSRLESADAKIQSENDYLEKLSAMRLGLLQDLLTQRVSVAPIM